MDKIAKCPMPPWLGQRVEPLWDKHTALEFCAMIWEKIAPEFHCALTGSCLYKGRSDKDLDLIIYPRNELKLGFNVEAAREKLRAAGLVRHKDGVASSTDEGGWDHRLVEIWAYEGKRVDVFFFNGDFTDYAAGTKDDDRFDVPVF